ncbi:hypothetical protein [Leptospira interrogans]|nr:hypothetical protein [Leptospira interrogans]
MRTCCFDEKGNQQMAGTIREKTDAKRRDGGTRSSEETSVMDEERRGSVIQSQSLVNFERG